MENQIEILHDINNYGLFNLFSVELSRLILYNGVVCGVGVVYFQIEVSTKQKEVCV